MKVVTTKCKDTISYDLYQPYTDNNDFSNETIDLSKGNKPYNSIT